MWAARVERPTYVHFGRFWYCSCISKINAQITRWAIHLRMLPQQLNDAQVARSLICPVAMNSATVIRIRPHPRSLLSRAILDRARSRWFAVSSSLTWIVQACLGFGGGLCSSPSGKYHTEYGSPNSVWTCRKIVRASASNCSKSSYDHGLGPVGSLQFSGVSWISDNSISFSLAPSHKGKWRSSSA